ncbi:MAG TPA: Rieske 2Fe-2S domain-containing protein [Pseudomonadales bacterium]|jgi:phenylpropionate dioxygenase-like ring-hydroxylating dioxygenase large terminal subunit
MLTAAQNEVLTLTGPDTDMGRVFRAYWQPVLLSREIEAEGAPKRVKILGEEFVAFRNGRGEVGVVEPNCPHRGAHLFFGRNELEGLRCVYHGWQFDVSGRCVDVPTADAKVAESIKPRAALRALSVKESCGIVWVHFGGGGGDVPQFDFMGLPEANYFVSKKLQECNWAQAAEGGIDTAHFSYLHANIEGGERAGLMPSTGANEPPELGRYRWMIEDSRPRFTVLEHEAGLVMCAARKADDDQLYWRLTQFMMPNHSMAPNSFPGDNHVGNTWVPIDDRSCWIYCYAYNPERPLSDRERHAFASGFGIFSEVDDEFVPVRNRGNDYLIDRNLQRYGSFTGITGISEQDAAIADSQGLIADRTRELLGQTDLGVVRFRQLMFEAVDAVRQGRPPRGAESPGAYRVRSGDAMSAKPANALEVVQERFGDLGGVNLSVVGD